jgi:hypothetical protein
VLAVVQAVTDDHGAGGLQLPGERRGGAALLAGDRAGTAATDVATTTRAATASVAATLLSIRVGSKVEGACPLLVTYGSAPPKACHHAPCRSRIRG